MSRQLPPLIRAPEFTLPIRLYRIPHLLTATALALLCAHAAVAQDAKAPAGAAPPANAPVASAPAPTAAAPPAEAAPAPAPAPASDPAGATVGNASDAANGAGPVVPQDPTDKADPDYAKKHQAYLDFQASLKKEPAAAAALDSSGQNRIAINIAWTLLTGYLVMFMQLGFALLETGFCRKKNAAHVMMTNLMIYPIGILSFWLLGWSLMFGAAGAQSTLGGTFGLTKGAWLLSMPMGKATLGFLAWNTPMLLGHQYDVGIFTLFLFQMVFMDTAATIPTGAMAERWKFSAFVVYGFFMCCVVYPIFGSWVWGGGWLSQLGVAAGLGNGSVDFAGSGVVHMVGGMVALAGAIVLGPRIGKFNKDGSPNAMPAHNLVLAISGTLILAFGWFGFNPGSTLGASGGGLLRIGVVATCTMLASASGAFAAMLYWWAVYKKPDPSMCCNGLLAGLVAITAPSAYVNSIGAVAIGAIAGVVVCLAVPAVEKAKVDDPVGAVAVHGVCGAWGVLSVGLFADGSWGGGLNGVTRNVTGLLYGGGVGQLVAQCCEVGACAVWAFGVAFAFFKIQDKIQGIRSSKEAELIGLDVPELGIEAYPEDAVAHGRHDAGVPAGRAGGTELAGAGS